jgi:hypothetical protein
MDSNLVVETHVSHMSTNVLTSIPLTERKTLEMDQQNFLDNIIQWLILKQQFYYLI